MIQLNILVVEDDFLIGLLLSDMLTGLGHAVCAVERTEAGAVAAALRLQPDMMIVDVHLSKGSGISAVETILRDGSVAHVFVTGDKLETQRQCPDAIVIEKPYRENDLVEAMNRAIEIKANVPRATLKT